MAHNLEDRQEIKKSDFLEKILEQVPERKLEQEFFSFQKYDDLRKLANFEEDIKKITETKEKQ